MAPDNLSAKNFSSRLPFKIICVLLTVFLICCFGIYLRSLSMKNSVPISVDLFEHTHDITKEDFGENTAAQVLWNPDTGEYSLLYNSQDTLLTDHLLLDYVDCDLNQDGMKEILYITSMGYGMQYFLIHLVQISTGDTASVNMDCAYDLNGRYLLTGNNIRLDKLNDQCIKVYISNYLPNTRASTNSIQNLEKKEYLAGQVIFNGIELTFMQIV